MPTVTAICSWAGSLHFNVLKCVLFIYQTNDCILAILVQGINLQNLSIMFQILDLSIKKFCLISIKHALFPTCQNMSKEITCIFRMTDIQL
jgi:hypothetical protein